MLIATLAMGTVAVYSALFYFALQDRQRAQYEAQVQNEH